jgi:hypothetical protein
VTDTVARQGLELRRVPADQASTAAQRQIDGATAAQKLVDAVVTADRDHRAQQTEADNAKVALAEVDAKARSADDRLHHIDLLERALDVRTADERVTLAQADVDKHAALRARREVEAGERQALDKLRAAIAVPAADALGLMRRLANDLAGARGALNVGLLVTVTPSRPIDIGVTKDGTVTAHALKSEALEVEANAEVDIDIADVAIVRVRGGRREAQQTVESLEGRWTREVAPHFAAANVTDLDGLSARIAEAQELDTRVKANDAEVQSLQVQIDSFVDSDDKLRQAFDHSKTCRAAIGNVPLETFSSDLSTLGADPTGALRERRQQVSRDLEKVRAMANQAGPAHTLAEERTRHSASALKEAIVARDAALAACPGGVAATLSAAQNALAAALAEQHAVVAELTSLESTIAAQNERVAESVRDARAAVEDARTRLEVAHSQRTKAITDLASQVGRLAELRRLRDAQDLATAEKRLRDATERLAAVPVPERVVTEAEVTAAQHAKVTAISDLARIEREIQRTHGALEQVGGAVARERLRDATEAFELAEQQEREIEADYDAWLLLLEQMKQAEAAQASNLGQTLAPAIAGRFEALTQRRYEGVRLTAQLGTEGVVIAGTVRPTARISVGTREQLSTLYRLALAEYLITTVVLDDQLVQSDGKRMDWFRELLAEKAHSFQIIVFTCRPGDYLVTSAMPKGKVVRKDTDGEFVRAVDLEQAVRGR